jgi:hypothetical protein
MVLGLRHASESTLYLEIEIAQSRSCQIMQELVADMSANEALLDAI